MGEFKPLETNILYISCFCSSRKNKEILKIYKSKSGQQAQKMHSLILRGLMADKSIALYALSCLPINRKMTRKLFFTKSIDLIEGFPTFYVPFINLPILRQLFLFLGVFFETIKWSKSKDHSGIIIIDILNFSALLGSIATKIFIDIPIIGIVTDIPIFRVQRNKKSPFFEFFIKLFNKTNLFLARKCEGFVLITEEMNNIVNHSRNPFTVIEGLVDLNMETKPNNLRNKYNKKVCHYAGGLLKRYGLEDLVNAFIQAGISDSELHIYGAGPYEHELRTITQEHSNVKFFGYKENELIVEEQIRSTLLVNPRPTNEDYTKYSFPSKNMEYMVSGTPILTSDLPGMPEEYKQYVYLLVDETKDGIKNALIDLLSKSPNELHDKGNIAKEFVLRGKNNIVQAQKIVGICKEVLEKSGEY